MSSPKITVVLTSYNHDKYLTDAIDSVLDQTFEDFELFIWDDASSDNSWQLIQKYRDPRIQAFRNEKQRRAVYGINRSISELSRAPYVAIHHSDDVWEPDKLEKQVALLDSRPEIGAVFTWAQIIDENGHPSHNEWFNRENQSQWKWLRELFYEENHLNHPSVLIRRQCYQKVGLYSYGLAQITDAEMWSRLLLSYPIYVLPDKLTQHRLFTDKSNMSGSRPEAVVRLNNEWNYLRTNFLRIQDPAVVYEIFPGIPYSFSDTGSDVKFLLAMACLYPSAQKNAWQLGIQWLFELMNTLERRTAIERIYGFSIHDLIRLTGKFDVYSVQELAAINQELAAINQELSFSKHEIEVLHQRLQELYSVNTWLASQCKEHEKTIIARSSEHQCVALKLRELEKEITDIHGSTSWKITKPLRNAKRWYAESKHIFKKIKKLRDYIVDPDFDAEFYLNAYPDVRGVEPYTHYASYGKKEGRLPCTPVCSVAIDAITKLDKSKENILLVSHEASRTGAPILAWNIAQQLHNKYNVIIYLMKGGDLISSFRKVSSLLIEPIPHGHNAYILSSALDGFMGKAGIKFAIVNSLVSHSILTVLNNNYIPSIFLIHEFASYSPKQLIRQVALRANQIIFSAPVVYEDSAAYLDADSDLLPVILPQGKCIVPADSMHGAQEQEELRLRKLFRPHSFPEDTVVVLGAGYVQLRKGVDLFLACAAKVLQLKPQNSFRFIWIGKGYNPDTDYAYSIYLKDQISRAGLEPYVCFAGEVEHIDTAYNLSDVLLLSSRLDPLPNVAIDAMSFKLPVLCFDNTTGIANVLKDNGLGEVCVVPYLDVDQAALRLVSLIDSQQERLGIGEQIRAVGEKVFNMESYVASLEQYALQGMEGKKLEKYDGKIIGQDGSLCVNFFALPAQRNLSHKDAIPFFLRSWKTGIDKRKPFPGFHPGVYEEVHGVSQSGKNPLADFIESGKPVGPWLYRVIPAPSNGAVLNNHKLRSALHVHVFYEDLFPDVFNRLKGMKGSLDLLISVPTTVIEKKIQSMVEGYRNGNVNIKIVPNRGRDIGPLFTTFGETIVDNYDVIGHVHTKKCLDNNNVVMGQIWFLFLLENLLGNNCSMIDTILGEMELNPKMGLVFPDDPWVVGWNSNRKQAEVLASELGIILPHCRHFNFPVGTMFWARTEALRPLFDRKFMWEDYPEEPLAYDGTMLHALERLLPFVAQSMHYDISLTYVHGITR